MHIDWCKVHNDDLRISNKQDVCPVFVEFLQTEHLIVSVGLLGLAKLNVERMNN